MKRLTSLCLTLAVLLSLCLMPLCASAAQEATPSGYYYRQLTTNDARRIYSALVQMLSDGSLQTGARSIDLVEDQILENKSYSKNALMADFSSAKDAFMLDYNVFYVDFDKLSLTYTEEAGQVSVLLGVGRDTTYFRQGFNRGNVSGAINAFDTQVKTIAAQANSKSALTERIKVAYDAVVNRVSYALESQAAPGNVDYVRTPYGALVKGQSVCEGYARAMKAILDTMGITNVLIQGTYLDEKGIPQPHMWNNVKMDDNRWYLLDATMEDGDAANTDEYYLVSNGNRTIMKNYQPDGIISLSSLSFEFNYPNVSGQDYVELNSDAFAILDTSNDTEKHISYRGMNVAQAKKAEKYVLVSFDGNTWYYYDQYMKFYIGNYDDFDFTYDFDGYFKVFSLTELAWVAVTDEPCTKEFAGSDPSTYTCSAAVSDQIQIGEILELEKAAPVVVTRTPANSRLEGNKTYTATATYSENLKKANAGAEVGIEWLNPIEGAVLSDFQWEEGSKTVSFTFTTVDTYAYSTGYYFRLVNLVGESSLKTPEAVGYTVVNNPSFACPKIQGDINEIYANTPALIADSNLADNNWTDENGEPIANYASSRLALVASELPQDESDAMVDKIEGISGGKEVLAAQTFDISLTLCSGQVSYITGNRVKVFIPFPAGYNSTNASFEAYHFRADGTPERIDCVTTEKGIIMMCESFSPFAVVATEKEAASSRQVITFASGNGTFTQELVTLDPGQSQTVTITADSGYRIGQVLLNGQPIQTTGKVRTTNDRTTVTLSYDALEERGNTLEASFVLKQISTDPVGDVFEDLITNHTPAQITAPEDGWQEGSNTFTVSHSAACQVAVTHDNGASYTRLTCTAVDGGYAFTTDLTADSKLLVFLAGDANQDGVVSTVDCGIIKAANLGLRVSSALGDLIFDVNCDGRVTTVDEALLTAWLLKTLQPKWNLAK